MGRDIASTPSVTTPRGFNPRAHVGRDVKPIPNACWRRFQSTRPRGARQVAGDNKSILAGFNPRAHVGRDLWLCKMLIPTVCFNPRAHVGRDLIDLILHKLGLVSIHAPTWGATTSNAPPFADLSFNPRAHVGRDHIRQTAHCRERVSIHAPTWGATLCSHFIKISCCCFNPRAHVGRDQETNNILIL